MLKLLIYIFIFYGLIFAVIILTNLTDIFILFPRKEDLSHEGLTRKTIKLKGNNSLEIWINSEFVRKDEPEIFVLHFGGNHSRAEEDLQEFSDIWRNYSAEIWSVNYPGYGNSDGRAQLKLIAPTALAVYDDFSKRAQNKPIIITGNSIGTTAALYLAATKNRIDGLFIKNPPPLPEMILGEHSYWNLGLLAWPVSLSVPKELNSINNARQATSPAIFLSAFDDKTVPISYQRKIIEAYEGEKRLIELKEGGHNYMPLIKDHQELKESIDWLIGKSNASLNK